MIKMPAGTYYVGDLCYVMHNEWDEACELFFSGRTDHGCNEGKFKLKDGREFVSFNTAYGDGEYYDTYGNAYDVDSGGIGCIRINNIKEDLPKCGFNIVTFDTDFECSTDDGILMFGRVKIDTDPVFEEEGEYEEEY